MPDKKPQDEQLPEQTDNEVRPEDGEQDDLPQEPGSVFGGEADE